MRRILILAALAWLLLHGGGHAAQVAGQDHPRFTAALEFWLSDDDERALPEFAALAAEGNRAAQVLLALISPIPRCRAPGSEVCPAPGGSR